MRAVALRGLFARKLRLTLTALAVALGVTLIAGTYVFTDTINSSFDKIFVQSNKGTDVSLSPNNDLSQEVDPPPIPGSVLRQVRQVDGVAAAEGAVFSTGGTFRKADGSKLKGSQGFNAVASVSNLPRFESWSVTEGRFPRTADEVVIPKSTADRNHFKVGDTLKVAADAPIKGYKITGIAKIAGVDSLGGATFALLTLPEAQRITNHRDAYDEIRVAAKPGTDVARLKADIQKIVPRAVDVRTGTEQAAKQSKDIRDNLGFLRTALLAFAGISLFVGAFIIFNTFSITVQQRTREFALLRTLGAKRKQVRRAVLGEGLFLGVLGSLVGLGLGLAVAAGLKALFKAVGFDVPSSGTVVATRTIVVSLLVGTIVTLIATMAPAWRAMRVPPMAALQEGYQREARRSRFATPIAAVLTLVGFGLIALGLFGSMKSSQALSAVGFGAVAAFLGVAMLSPRLVGPIAGAVGRPIERTRGITGRLARENSVRQPGRTAVTAAALMVGVAMVTFAAVFAAGARTTISNAVENGVKGQSVVQNQDGFSPFSPTVTKAVREVPGVKDTAAVRFGTARLDGQKKGISGVDKATFSSLYTTGWVDGDGSTIAKLGPGLAVVSKGYAESKSLKVGDHVTVQTATRKTLRPQVIGIIHDKGGLTSNLIVDNDTAARDYGLRKDAFVLVGYDGSRPDTAVTASIKQLLDTRFPQAEALTNKEFVKQQEDQINQLLALIYALLTLAIIVSLFGIVNTLVLSISERTRELGLLRAIGMSRRQVRRVIRYEAIITALIGGVIGLGLGLVLSLLVTQAIDDFSLSIPYGQLILVLILAGLAGVLAAILPARRASRLNVLESLAYE
jgi:putative ABC transport system permease protein